MPPFLSVKRKKKEGRDKTPIIAVSAYGTIAIKEDCEQAGMDGYIPKPVRIPELFKVVEKFH